MKIMRSVEGDVGKREDDSEDFEGWLGKCF